MEEIMNLLRGVNGEISTLFSNKLLVGVILIFLIIATYTDLKSMKIYDKFNIMFLITRIVFSLLPIAGLYRTGYGHRFTLNHLVGGGIGFLFLLIPAMALMHKMGGDIKFMGIMGTFLGGYSTVAFLLISCFYNLVFSMFFIFVLGKGKKDTKLPFAPFFLLAFLTLFLWFKLLPIQVPEIFLA